MSIIVLDDCVTLRNGAILCYDRDCKKFYEFTKKEVTVDAITPRDMARLMEKVASKGGNDE